MEIVPLTLTISLCLVFTFVVFFLTEHARGRLSSSERDSLLPLGEESPRLARIPASGRPRGHADDGHECGCRDGSRPPCTGCLRQRD